MRNLNKKKIFYGVIVLVTLIILLYPDMNKLRTYEYIEKENVLDNLIEETAENFTSSSLINCDYTNIIHDEATLSISLVDGDLIESHKIKQGGEFAPSECKPKYSTAIIVPYRDRAEQLRGFLVYMHTFFHFQLIHYRIFVVEQMDSLPFNRAKLLNIGALAALKAGYPCLILHDVDLLPLRPANLYACTELPRHMSSTTKRYSFTLPSIKISNGAIAISSKQFKEINGMSNEFYGQEGEDEDLYSRLHSRELKLCRFEPATSLYHLFSNEQGDKSLKRKKSITFTKERMFKDGLNSLKYTEVATVLHPLFTHIMVDL